MEIKLCLDNQKSTCQPNNEHPMCLNRASAWNMNESTTKKFISNHSKNMIDQSKQVNYTTFEKCKCTVCTLYIYIVKYTRKTIKCNV